jgi:hypothetical protein
MSIDVCECNCEYVVVYEICVYIYEIYDFSCKCQEFTKNRVFATAESHYVRRSREAVRYNETLCPTASLGRRT